MVDVATGAQTLATPKGGPEKVAYAGPRVERRRQGDLRHHRPRVRVPAPRLPRPRDGKHTYLTVAHPVGRRQLRPLPRREDDRLRDERGGHERPAPPRHGHREGEARAEAPGGRHRRPRVAQQRPRPRPRPHLGPLRRPTSTRSTSRPGSSSAGRRARRAGSNAQAFSEPELVRWKSFDGRTISGFLYRPAARFTGPRRHRQHPRRARGPVAPRLPGPEQLLPRRAGRRDPLPERARLHGLRQDLPEARQRDAPRGLGEGHRRAPRLDRHAAGPRRRARHGHGRQLRRLHDARGGHALRREDPLRARRRRHLELRHLPGEHRGLPPRPAPRGVRRRARPGHARVPAPDRAR